MYGDVFPFLLFDSSGVVVYLFLQGFHSGLAEPPLGLDTGDGLGDGVHFVPGVHKLNYCRNP